MLMLFLLVVSKNSVTQFPGIIGLSCVILIFDSNCIISPSCSSLIGIGVSVSFVNSSSIVFISLKSDGVVSSSMFTPVNLNIFKIIVYLEYRNNGFRRVIPGSDCSVSSVINNPVSSCVVFPILIL